MPATSKSELLNVTEKEFAKLQKLLATIPEDQALEKLEDVSIKDMVGHRAHWITLFLGWYHDGQAGHEVHFPAEGYKWNELPRYNASIRAAQSDLGWQAAQDLLSAGHQKLTAFVEGLSNEALYGGPMKGARNDWTPGRWAEAAGPSHYRSATKYIRAQLRSLAEKPTP